MIKQINLVKKTAEQPIECGVFANNCDYRAIVVVQPGIPPHTSYSETETL